MTIQQFFSRLQRSTSAALCVVLLASCAVGPDFVKPVMGLHGMGLTPRQGSANVPAVSDSAIPAQWWMLFNDALLSDLESRAQAENLDLQMASERIEQSRAQLGIASAELLPSIAGGASHTREALSKHG